MEQDFVYRSAAYWKLATFVVLLITFTAAVALLKQQMPAGTTILFVTWSPAVADVCQMWSVGIAGLLALLIIDHSVRDLGFSASRPKYYLLAAAVPVGYCFLIYAPLWASGVAGFRGEHYLVTRSATALLHLPFFALLACGEEIGWRGVLVPNLARHFSFTASALVSGVAWALWHWPDILFFGYNNGCPVPYAIVCFSVAVVGMGMFAAWLRLASGSLWPAILFHAVHNLAVYRLFEPVTIDRDLTRYFTPEFGIGFALAGIVLGHLFWKSRPDDVHAPLCPRWLNHTA
jgi:membrane protease YdiL (CAAX protease family)